jgi:MFS family permease
VLGVNPEVRPITTSSAAITEDPMTVLHMLRSTLAALDPFRRGINEPRMRFGDDMPAIRRVVTPRGALAAIASAQLLALTLWFSASAVAPTLQDIWMLSEGATSGLTLAVQIGFVIGALGLSIAGIPDRFNSRHIVVVSAVVGAIANAALVLVDSDLLWLALLLRLLTGAALAGVYPSGLKVMAGWFDRGRGMALGPHLIRGLGFDWQPVVLTASALALLGALIMALLVTDGPHETPTSPFSWRTAGAVLRNRGWRLSTLGYLGHMWELYAMWTWTAAFLSASALERGLDDGWVSTATFAIIAIGGVGAWIAGVVADRRGRTATAGAAMAASGTAALMSPLVFGAAPTLTIALFLVWGVAVIADSAQFSAMATETSDTAERGTALTLQTALGFLLTLVTIRGVPMLADAWGWQWAFPILALGPAVGVVAMIRLHTLPEARQIAGGLG